MNVALKNIQYFILILLALSTKCLEILNFGSIILTVNASIVPQPVPPITKQSTTSIFRKATHHDHRNDSIPGFEVFRAAEFHLLQLFKNAKVSTPQFHFEEFSQALQELVPRYVEFCRSRSGLSLKPVADPSSSPVVEICIIPTSEMKSVLQNAIGYSKKSRDEITSCGWKAVHEGPFFYFQLNILF